MNCRFADLRHKEVISACDGTRLGFVDDVIVDTKTACIVSFVIFGRMSFFGLFGKCEDYIIPWEKIQLIGEDTIIISCKTPNPVKRQKKRRFHQKIKKIHFLTIRQNKRRKADKYVYIAQLIISLSN